MGRRSHWIFGDYPSDATQRVQALNATIMASEIYNDYVTDPDIGAETDWLLTFLTRAFHINGTEPVEPFSQLWTGQSACEPSKLSVLDREESTATTRLDDEQPDFSPAPPTPPARGRKIATCPSVTSQTYCSSVRNQQRAPPPSLSESTLFSMPKTDGQRSAWLQKRSTLL